jgi:hypothetical protein
VPRKLTKVQDLTETPDITPGTWVFMPGDSGDASVGMQGYAPTISVEIPDSDGDYVELAELRDLVYSVAVPPYDASKDSYHQEYDTGERYLPGSPDQNGLLMAGAPGLLRACQQLLQELRYEQGRVVEGRLLVDLENNIKGRIELLEDVIKQAVVFPES